MDLEDPIIVENVNQLSFYTKLCDVFRISIFAVFGIIIALMVMLSIYVASNSIGAIKIIQSQDFWKVLITIASPIAFVLSTFNIIESKRIDILKIIIDYSDETVKQIATPKK